MQPKWIVRWIIVLFLLAALPAMTVVMAQGQEPAKQLALESEQVEVQTSFLEPAVNCNLNESELNNTRSTADVFGFGDVICGYPEYDDESETCGPDWFRFNMPRGGYVMITVLNSGTDGYTGFELSDGTGHSIEDVNPYGVHIMFHSLTAGDYFVHAYNYLGEDCDSYKLILESPLLISAAAANLGTGSVAGIPFRSEDILSYSHLNNGEERWAMFFDGSDVGVKTLTNIAKDSGNRILITTGGNQTLPGVGAVTPWDIAIFDATQYGSNTEGTFRMGLDGSEHQLTTSGEKLDGIDGWTNGYDRCYGYPVSTAGVATITGWLGTMKQDDEDVFCKGYNGAWQPYDWFFDVNGKFDAPASEPAPGNVTGLAGEDVFALAYNNNTNEMYLTILGNGKIAGHKVTQKDIFAINYPGYTWGGVVWHGPDHGWNYNIDAIELNGW